MWHFLQQLGLYHGQKSENTIQKIPTNYSYPFFTYNNETERSSLSHHIVSTIENDPQLNISPHILRQTLTGIGKYPSGRDINGKTYKVAAVDNKVIAFHGSDVSPDQFNFEAPSQTLWTMILNEENREYLGWAIEYAGNNGYIYVIELHVAGMEIEIAEGFGEYDSEDPELYHLIEAAREQFEFSGVIRPNSDKIQARVNYHHKIANNIKGPDAFVINPPAFQKMKRKPRIIAVFHAVRN